MDTKNYVAVHVDESAITIESEGTTSGDIRQPLNGFVVEPEVQDSVHHPWHGLPRPRSNRN